MKFLIIIPAHNEAAYVRFTLESLERQTFRDFYCIVVNDGSTDETAEIVGKFVADNPAHFHALHLESSVHEPGAKVVRTFYHGLSVVDKNAFDVICKFDADIIFPSDYLMQINEVFQHNPRAGMVSGLVKIGQFDSTKAFEFDNADHAWTFENLSSKNHVRGPIKSYRKECFDRMNGLRPVLGWDNIDVMLAQKHGWEVCTVKELWVKHLRPTAFKYKNKKAQKLGEYFYNIGLSLPLAMISSAKSSLKNKSFSEFFITLATYLKQKQDRSLTAEEIHYIRKLRWRQLFRIK